MFHAGLPEWKKAGGLVISEADNVKKMIAEEASYVLVDLRPADEVAKGFLPGAVSVPSDKIATSQALFPADKGAPVILYNASGVDIDAYKAVRSWGYKNTTVLNGGFEGWKASGGKLISSAVATKIDYVKRTPKGQISIEEFKSVIAGKPADKLILDVRDKPTASKGQIAGAMQLPQDELAARMNELPKDKEILIHCNTGILASMAADALKTAGYTVRYLDAVVQVDAQGAFEITEK